MITFDMSEMGEGSQVDDEPVDTDDGRSQRKKFYTQRIHEEQKERLLKTNEFVSNK